MKSEIQFFIYSETDEILNKYSSAYDAIEDMTAYELLIIGTNKIQIEYSKVFDNHLTAGRLAFMTIDESDSRAEELYKALRKEIKKICSNKMRMKSVDGKYYKSNTFYFSNSTREWLAHDRTRELRQFKNGGVIFEIEE